MALTGRFPLLLLLGLIPVIAAPNTTTVLIWLAIVVLLAGLDWLLAPSPTRLELARAPLGSVRVGQPTSTEVTVTNPTSGRVRGVLRDGWQPSAGATGTRHPLRLTAAGSARLRTGLTPIRRGDLTARGLTLRLFGPLGLSARQRTLQVPGSVRSLPAFESRKHLPSRLARLRELDGRAAVRIRGQGTEFDSLREYVVGDDVRSIDWRASARNQKVVVRTWQPERDRRVVLALDTSRTAAGRIADVPRLDSGMDAALLLAALAARAGDRIDFLAGDQRVRARTRVSPGPGVVATLQNTMADLQPAILEADWATLATAISAFGKQRALVVLLTPLEPASIQEGLLPVLPTLTRHHRVVVASVRDPELAALARTRSTAEDVWQAAAAELALVQRRRTAAMLTVLGVDVLDTDAESLPPALADHYLQLKARGLL